MITDPTAQLAKTDLASSNAQLKAAKPTVDEEVALRFEQMLWAEMLSHAGLEDVLTKNGGEAASAFSRFVVESIAADIAEKHPLGLSASVTEQAVEGTE